MPTARNITRYAAALLMVLAGAVGSCLLPGSDLPDDGVRRFDIKATQYAYEPSRIVVRQGDEVHLRLASGDASDSDILEALDTARLLEFVRTLTDGLDTWIGEAGKMISGGQARRLAVARAVLQGNPVWILDEPTEGLDLDTERHMMRRIEAATQGKTVILATHRLVDMDRMDRILLMEGGTIVEEGTHEELISGPTRYAAMHDSILG